MVLFDKPSARFAIGVLAIGFVVTYAVLWATTNGMIADVGWRLADVVGHSTGAIGAFVVLTSDEFESAVGRTKQRLVAA